MAYEGLTPKRNPVNAQLHKEYTDYQIESDDGPEDRAKNYDEWYTRKRRPKQQQSPLASIEAK